MSWARGRYFVFASLSMVPGLVSSVVSLEFLITAYFVRGSVSAIYGV